MTKSFDVFLSHNSRDKPAVRALAEALQDRSLKVWLDEWELIPGRPWQEALEEVIKITGASAVLVGKDGLGPWQDAEMRGCLAEFVRRKLPVIPVLLPGAPEEPRLPLFLSRFTWVDLRGGLTEEGIDRLQWGITAKRPVRSKPPAAPTAAPEVVDAPTAAPAQTPPASAAVRPVTPEIEASATTARERPLQKVRARWGVPAWLGLLTLLGVAVFLFVQYFPRQEPKQEPGVRELAREPTGRPPVPPALVPTSTCAPKEERGEAGIVFVRICPGTFIMGSADNDTRADSDEKPAHEVRLSEFWIGKTEITNEQYRGFKPKHQGEDALPAVEVSWTEAKEACEDFGGRLPTEAEWGYAARAGSRTAWSFGDDAKLLDEYAWYSGNSGSTLHSVGTRKANAWGLHDMHGNVWEWVADWKGTYSAAVQSILRAPPQVSIVYCVGAPSTSRPWACAPRTGSGAGPWTGSRASAFAVRESPAASFDFCPLTLFFCFLL